MMTKSMTEYLNDLTSSDLNTLDQIITLQYRKFVRFYKLIKDYSDNIKKVKYEFSSSSSLDILIVFNTKKNLELAEQGLLSSMESNGYDGDVKTDNKNLYMSIVLDEEKLSTR